MRVFTVPCWSDNFSFLVGAANQPDVVVVDPCDPKAVLQAVEAHQLRIRAILNTHHHRDHVGGNRAVLERFPGIEVHAHRSDFGRIPGQTRLLEDGDTFDLVGLHFRVLFVPGHTLGHIAYLTDGAAFVGDTLFGAGCGRLFEGTAEMLHQSLQKLAALPPETQLYFAHEYTAANLRFAKHVEPGNPAIDARLADLQALRAHGQWSTPSTLALELETNPFLRVAQPSIQSSVADRLGPRPGPADVFRALREAKDAF